MVFSLTIAGVAKLLKAGSLNIRQIINSRHTASFQLDSIDRSYRPARDAEVLIEEDGTRIFGGLIDRPLEAGMGGPRFPGIRTTINVVDFNAYTERRYVAEDFPEQTLKARLTTLVNNYLDDFGVSLHGSQVDGPTLPAATYDYIRVDAVLNETVKLTADAGQPYVWRIDYTKVLRAYQPSTQAAPFDLVGNDLTQVIGDIEVEPSNQGKANRVVVKVAPKSEVRRIESFTADGVEDTFSLEYTVTHHYGYVTGDAEAVPQVNETLTTPEFAGEATWELDTTVTPNTITRVAGAPTAGKVIEFPFDGTFSGTWTSEDATWTSTPSSRREKVLLLESIPDGTTGQAFADAELAKSLTGPTTVRYKTWEQGILPGQSQTINVSARNVNEAGVITEVVVKDLVHRLERTVTVIVDDAQTNLDRTWGDVYRLWAGDKTARPQATAVGTGGSGSSGPGLPFRSVQFNNSGAFGGDEDFTYELNGVTDALNVGPDNTVAANAEHIYTFGTGIEVQ